MGAFGSQEEAESFVRIWEYGCRAARNPSLQYWQSQESVQCKEPMQDPAGAKHRQVSLRDGAAIRINEAHP